MEGAIFPGDALEFVLKNLQLPRGLQFLPSVMPEVCFVCFFLLAKRNYITLLLQEGKPSLYGGLCQINLEVHIFSDLSCLTLLDEFLPLHSQVTLLKKDVQRFRLETDTTSSPNARIISLKSSSHLDFHILICSMCFEKANSDSALLWLCSGSLGFTWSLSIELIAGR